MADTLIGADPRAAFAAQLRQMFGNVGAFTSSQRPVYGEGYGPDASQTVYDNPTLRKLLEQAALQGGRNGATARWVAGQDIGFDPAANRYTVVVQAPESLGRQAQRFGLDFNPDGSLAGMRDVASGNEDFSGLDKLLMAGALAAIGYAAAPALFGGAGAPAAAAPIVESTPSWVAPGAMSTGTTGAATDLLAGTSLAGSTAAPMMSYIPGMEPITAQSLLAGGAGATVANGVTAADIAAAAGQPELGLATQAPVAPQSAAAAPISASQATTVASPFKMALDAVKPYASLIGPATSLLGAATAQTPQMPQNADARIPGVEAPPEARGLDRQAARSPILDVLGRNRRENRNRTLLTGPGGVNMDSVRVGRNTLLGA